jgi:hypothetical protein
MATPLDPAVASPSHQRVKLAAETGSPGLSTANQTLRGTMPHLTAWPL